MSLSRRFLLAGVGGLVAARTLRAQPDVPAIHSDVPFRQAPRSIAEARHSTLASNSADAVASAVTLVVDCSHSMDDDEFSAELNGHAEALMPGTGDQPSALESAILHKMGDKSIALCAVKFSSMAEPAVNWVDLRATDPNLRAKMRAFAEEVRAIKRYSPQSTNIGHALEVGQSMIAHCPWPVSERKVIDVCADGKDDNYVRWTRRNVRRIASAGITVNGLTIIGPEALHMRRQGEDLTEYFKAVIATQPEDNPDIDPGFVVEVAEVIDTGQDIKILREQGDARPDLTLYQERLSLALKHKIIREMAGRDDGERLSRMLADSSNGNSVPQFSPQFRLMRA